VVLFGAVLRFGPQALSPSPYCRPLCPQSG